MALAQAVVVHSELRAYVHGQHCVQVGDTCLPVAHARRRFGANLACDASLVAALRLALATVWPRPAFFVAQTIPAATMDNDYAAMEARSTLFVDLQFSIPFDSH